jgi:hypothetical protein
MSGYQGAMPSFMNTPIAHRQPSRCKPLVSRVERRPRAATTIALVALGLGLAGCAGSVSEFGDDMTTAFADPARYDFYDCKQLQAERKAINGRIDDLKRLMAKAETGVAGPVVAEIVYRQDYIADRGQLKFVDEVWRRNKCVEVPEPANAPAGPPVVLSGKGKGKKGQGQGGPTASRSGNAVN